MKTFKSISEFKRILAVGDKLKITRRGQELSLLEVSKVRSTCFAVAMQKEGGFITNAWVDFPKARDCEIIDGKLVIPDNWSMKGDSEKPKPINPKFVIEFAA